MNELDNKPFPRTPAPGWRENCGRAVSAFSVPLGVSSTKKNGFTLIEMLIVGTVMGLIMAVSLPGLSKAYRQQATRGAVDRLRMAHSLAQATAVQQGRVAELHIDAAYGRFWVEVDTSGTGVSDTVGMMIDVSGQVVMQSTRALLCFDSRGLTTTRGACESGDVVALFSLSGRTDTLQTSVLGKVLR